MKAYESFYRNGFEIFNFDASGLNDVLKNILSKNLKPGFSLQQKYSSTLDLRPTAIDYDSCFLDVLKKNDAKNLIRSRTLKDLTLYHIQVRTSSCTTSYMDWHRDTYYDLGKKIGMTPPGCKIIYYPKFDENSSPRLQVIPTSQRLMIDNRNEDLKFASHLPKTTIFTSNNQALLFDTSLLHAVVPDKPEETSIRLIYSFVAKEQLTDSGSEELHFKTSKMYEELV